MDDMFSKRAERVNYHHLHYFLVVARQGGLVPAGKVLRLSHPTLSTQIHALEDQLDEKLVTKVGRKLALTEVGPLVYRYADEIFTLGREMVDTVRRRTTGQPLRLEAGVVDVVPKLIVRRLLQPAAVADRAGEAGVLRGPLRGAAGGAGALRPGHRHRRRARAVGEPRAGR
jgi:LysR family transcriptional activator of nhaA